MKKFRIESATVEGFRSFIEELTFDYSNSGVFILRGPIGVGKTSLFELPVWVLFGTNLKGAPKANVATWKWLRNKKTYKGTRGMITLRDKATRYLIVRHIDYKGETVGIKGGSSLMVLSKPVKDNTPWDHTHLMGDELYKKDQQSFINNLLGLDADTFINSMIFGQNMSRLMAADSKDLRSLFDTIFNTAWVDVLKDKALVKINEHTINQNKYLNSITGLKTNIANNRERFQANQTLQSNYVEDKANKIKDLKASIAVKTQELHVQEADRQKAQQKLELEDQESGIEELQETADQARQTRNLIDQRLHKAENDAFANNSNIEAKQRQLDQYWLDIKNIRTTCPTCEGPIAKNRIQEVKDRFEVSIKNVTEAKKELDGKQVKLNAVVVGLKAELKQANEAMETAASAIRIAKEKSSGRVAIVQSINQHDKTIAVLKESISSLKLRGRTLRDETPPDYKLKEIKLAIENDKAKLVIVETGARATEEMLEHLQWWNKKAFGSGGMKSFVFSAMLGSLNEAMIPYGLQLGFRAKFWIDLDKTNKPFKATVYEGTEEIDYLDLSGGQKQKLNLAVAFAMYDIVSATSKFNWMFMDEPFDGLGVQDIEVVGEIIRLKSEEIAIYVVSHNPVYDISGSTELTISGGDNHNTTKIN